MAEKEVWQAIRDALAAGRRCALLVVTDSRGSSPGRTGMLMAVSHEGPLAGSIGGGKIESARVDEAVQALQGSRLAPRRWKHSHRPEAPDSSGMVCGGEQTVAFCPLYPSQLHDVERLLTELDQARPVDWVMDTDGWRFGPDDDAVRTATAWRYRHTSGPRITVCLVGGGHVSLALSRLLAWLGFRVLVLEERPGISTFEQNTFAHERRLGPFESGLAALPEGDDIYAAIMTHAHERDRAALDILCTRRLGYLGLLGSRTKIRHLLDGREIPDTLRAPAGMPIHSHSPEEIAVSIAAEMIRCRHGGTS